jgi:hypothetical protein
VRLPRLNDYALSGIALLAGALALLLVAGFTNRGDLTSATLFLCGVACFLSGVFMISFSREEPVDADAAALFPAAGTLNVCRIGADLGLRGDAWFLPPEEENGAVREFIPADGEGIPASVTDFSFQTGGDIPGLLVVPAAWPLVASLESTAGLRLPQSEPELLAALPGICIDVLQLAGEVEGRRAGDALVVSVRGYRLYPGCRVVSGASPKCCTMHPCGICSLVACLLALGLHTPWRLDVVRLEEGSRGITIMLRGAAGR